MNYEVIMTYKCIGRISRVYEVDAESKEDAIKLASSGKGYNGEDIDSIDIVGEPDIIVEENE
jgi:hypothetical protein